MLTTEKILEAEPRLKEFMDLFWKVSSTLSSDLTLRVHTLGTLILKGGALLADSDLKSSLENILPEAEALVEEAMR